MRRVTLLVALVLCASPTAGYAQSSPQLTVAPDVLARSLACSAGVDHPSRAPVLLVHGTGVTGRENWSHFYEPGLTNRGIPWCAVEMPQRATGDIQINAQYVVHGIRELHRRAGRRIAIVGASQGGMVPRWALRFWPDTRAMVDDLVGLAPSNHGTTLWPDGCQPCQPAGWQQSAGSAFIRALNAGQETFPGISYTNVYTHNDETVQPNSDDMGSSSLHGGGGRIANIAVQEICPFDPAEHILLGFADPIGYALAIDAIDHDGPAAVERVAPRGCGSCRKAWELPTSSRMPSTPSSSRLVEPPAFPPSRPSPVTSRPTAPGPRAVGRHASCAYRGSGAHECSPPRCKSEPDGRSASVQRR